MWSGSRFSILHHCDAEFHSAAPQCHGGFQNMAMLNPVSREFCLISAAHFFGTISLCLHQKSTTWPQLCAAFPYIKKPMWIIFLISTKQDQGRERLGFHKGIASKSMLEISSYGPCALFSCSVDKGLRGISSNGVRCFHSVHYTPSQVYIYSVLKLW